MLSYLTFVGQFNLEPSLPLPQECMIDDDVHYAGDRGRDAHDAETGPGSDESHHVSTG